MSIPPFGSAPTPDATTTKKGKIKLAGDLGGTADAPTVPALATVGKSTPTTLQADLTLSNYTQMLFRQHMIVGSRNIIIGTDASLIGV